MREWYIRQSEVPIFLRRMSAQHYKCTVGLFIEVHQVARVNWMSLYNGERFDVQASHRSGYQNVTIVTRSFVNQVMVEDKKSTRKFHFHPAIVPSWFVEPSYDLIKNLSNEERGLLLIIRAAERDSYTWARIYRERFPTAPSIFETLSVLKGSGFLTAKSCLNVKGKNACTVISDLKAQVDLTEQLELGLPKAGAY